MTVMYACRQPVSEAGKHLCVKSFPSLAGITLLKMPHVINGDIKPTGNLPAADQTGCFWEAVRRALHPLPDSLLLQQSSRHAWVQFNTACVSFRLPQLRPYAYQPITKGGVSSFPLYLDEDSTVLKGQISERPTAGRTIIQPLAPESVFKTPLCASKTFMWS